jgi:outer membrane lipoprotein SlyB
MNPSITPIQPQGESAARGGPPNSWLIGGGLALVAAGALATALVIRPPGASVAAADAEPRETVVSTKSPVSAPFDGPNDAAKAPVASSAGTPPAATNRSATPVARSAPAEKSRPVVCADCGTVESVSTVERGEKPSGVGAVAGAVAGGLLGSQMGGGSGKDAMTVIGAVGGGVAGHQIEKRSKTRTEYVARVRMADGSLRTVSHPSPIAAGAKVRVDGEQLVVEASPVKTQTASTTTAPSQRSGPVEPPSGAGEGAPPEARSRSMADAKRL